ncbi:hypothetical protein C1J03_11125 [Sulfitobacter sp. SK012]|uniref:helix-turn-helix transcriptional regulator n=1 Tax=Sulfitobacter sp. SK012 TaxID=1389005 RepID=UPI000E0ACCF4|nr:AlpA family phage regulatory protein [Sulfitobacter sp. SK012]AXI46520.1 hypothetical protein C1J03_11125 [Sulfitobacter sp. SK012]
MSNARIHSRVLKLKTVVETTSLSRATIYVMMGRGEFPKPIRLGRRAVAWRETDVLNLLSSRATVSYPETEQMGAAKL